jgi:hypothetical protein
MAHQNFVISTLPSITITIMGRVGLHVRTNENHIKDGIDGDRICTELGGVMCFEKEVAGRRPQGILPLRQVF